MLASASHKPAHTPKNHPHWLFGYLRGTANNVILFKATIPNVGPNLYTYSDADFANDHTRKFRTGVVYMSQASLISWKSRRQSVVAEYTYEA